MNGDPESATSTADDIDRLLAHALLVMRYLADTGKLADASLGKAMDAMTKARANGDTFSAYGELGAAFGKAIRATGKTSFEEVRRAAAVLSQDKHQSLKQLITAAMAIVFILVAVLGFVTVQDINDNVAELQKIILENPIQKLAELRRIISEGALSDPRSAYYQQYLKAHYEVSLMFDKATQILHRTEASTRRRNWSGSDSGGSQSADEETGIANQIFNIVLYQLIGPPSLATGAGSTSAPNAVGSGATARNNTAPTSPSAASRNAATEPQLYQAATGGTLDGVYTPVVHVSETDCKPYDRAPVERLFGKGNKQFLAAALDKFDDFCLAQTLDIEIRPYRAASAIHTVRVLQDQLYIIGVLFLPLVGGLLGATISIVYGAIDHADLRYSLAYLLIRVIVGGAFGVMIGWFSATGSGASTDMIQHVSGTPFTLAIIAGFSTQSLSAVMTTFSTALQKNERPPKIRATREARAPRAVPDGPVTARSDPVNPA